MKRIICLSFFIVFICSKDEKIKTKLKLENYTLYKSIKSKNNSSLINSRISISMSKKIDDVLINGTIFSETDMDSSRFPENDDGTSFYRQNIGDKKDGLTFSELYIEKKLKNSIDLLVGKKSYDTLMLLDYCECIRLGLPKYKKLGKINFYMLSKKAIFEIDEVADWSNISEKNNSIIGFELKKQFSNVDLELGYHFSSREYINYALKVDMKNSFNPVKINTSLAVYGKDWASNTSNLNEKLTKVECNCDCHKIGLEITLGQVKIGDTPHTFLVPPEDILVEEVPNYKNAKTNYFKFNYKDWEVMLANVEYDIDKRKQKFKEYSLTYSVDITKNQNQSLNLSVASLSGDYDFENRKVFSLNYSLEID